MARISRYLRVAKCRDGYIMHCTLGDWTSLVEWVAADGKAHDLTEPQWKEFAYRRDHAEQIPERSSAARRDEPLSERDDATVVAHRTRKYAVAAGSSEHRQLHPRGSL